MRLRTLILIQHLVCATLYAQDFKVVLTTSDKITRSTAKITVKLMEELPRTETVTVPPECFLVLVDKSSSVFEFNGVGQVKLDTLKGSRTASRFDLSKINILYSDMPILRDLDDAPYVIFYPFAFSNSISVVDSITLQWKDRVLREGVQRDYVVQVRTQFDEPLLKEMIGQATELTIYMDKLNDEKAVVRVQDRRYWKTLKSEYKFLEKRKAKCNDAPLNSLGTTLLIGLYLEVNGFLPDAYDYFKKARAMNPGIVEVEEIVMNFKKRNGFH